MDIRQDDVSLIEKQYKDGLDYQKQMSFATKWPEYERMKAGDQWPQTTERTKNLPRPVFNILRFILNHKIASVMNENIKMVFTPEEVPEPNRTVPEPTQPGTQPLQPSINPELESATQGADEFTKFSDSTWENINQDELNEDALDDAATLGTCYIHYYWDNDLTGGITMLYKGDMAGEVIDPINVFVGNPQQKNIQKQPYILVTSRDMVANVKDLAKANKVPIEKIQLIQPDKDTNNEGYDSAQKELNDSQKVTIITKYWKEQGRVYFCKYSSGVIIQPKTDMGLGSQRGFKRYPIATMPWEKRKKSINGVSEAEGLIPNQKAINFLIAMMLLSVQDTAWPKILAKVGSLNQQITNTPGEIITDHNPTPGDNIKYMTPGTFSQAAPLLIDKILDLTRTVTGANEASTGDPFTKQLNAAAIIAMQNAAKIPIDQIKKRFYRMMKDVGKIWEEFYKVKYNTDRVVTVQDENNKEVPMMFNGSNYENVPMRLKIDVGASSSYSESLMMSSLDNFLAQKYITFEQYLEYAPQNVVPFKDRLLKDIETQRKQQALMAQQPNMSAIMANLTPQAQMLVQQHPEILQQMMGGMQNGSMPPIQAQG